MKLSDYVVDYLANVLGIRHVFMIVGGANLHLADSFSKSSKVRYVCVQHEQAASMSAEGYAKASNGMGVALVTSGPGGTNALTGLCCAWMDSSPCLFLSGQVSLWDYTEGTTIRQLGVQQINIIGIVKTVTKYAEIVRDPLDIRMHLDKAAYLAREGRPGPVWLDIPQNVQMAQIEPKALKGWSPQPQAPVPDEAALRLPEVFDLLRKAQRPILIVGNGVRLARAEALLWRLIETIRFPIITTWSALDLVPEDHPLYVGRSGVFGSYGANFAVANSDLILSLGSRLDTRQAGTRRNTFAREAKKIAVDISGHELRKELFSIDIPVCEDIRNFLERLLPVLGAFRGEETSPWVKRCQEWKRRYPCTLPSYSEEKGHVNPYVFVDTLCETLHERDLVVTDMGTSLTCTHQAFKVKQGQRLLTNTGLAPMGYGLPAAIGAWFATGKPRLICLHGDGGLQMNIQELQTVVHYGIPLKLFVMNNREYVTIKHTQHNYFGGKIVGSDPATGYSVPDFIRVAQAYGLRTETIRDHAELRSKIRRVLESDGPVLCDVNLASNHPLAPLLLQHTRADGLTVTDPIERLSPYLSDKEFRANMIVKPLED